MSWPLALWLAACQPWRPPLPPVRHKVQAFCRSVLFHAFLVTPAGRTFAGTSRCIKRQAAVCSGLSHRACDAHKLTWVHRMHYSMPALVGCLDEPAVWGRRPRLWVRPWRSRVWGVHGPRLRPRPANVVLAQPQGRGALSRTLHICAVTKISATFCVFGASSPN